MVKYRKFRYTDKFHWECDKCKYKCSASDKKGLKMMIEDHKKRHKRRPLGWPVR